MGAKFLARLDRRQATAGVCSEVRICEGLECRQVERGHLRDWHCSVGECEGAELHSKTQTGELLPSFEAAFTVTRLQSFSSRANWRRLYKIGPPC